MPEGYTYPGFKLSMISPFLSILPFLIPMPKDADLYLQQVCGTLNYC